MKRFSTTLFLSALPLLQACHTMDNDGSSSDDGIAMICGVIGVIAVLVGLFGRGNTVRAVLVGVALIIA
ncbi:MAG: hypothetical protein Q7S48_01035 [bacterium]|nr:hypothetical protein [bacterium]